MMIEQKEEIINFPVEDVLPIDDGDVLSKDIKINTDDNNEKNSFRDISSTDVKSVLLRLQRVSHGASGGRVFSYNALVIVGDEANNIGFASAKAKLASEAIRKAKRLAQKSSISFSFGGKSSLPFEIEGRYHSTKVYLRPAREGSGLRASFIVRSMLTLLGLRNVSSKIIGGRHRVSVALATIDALQNMERNIGVFSYRNKNHD